MAHDETVVFVDMEILLFDWQSYEEALQLLDEQILSTSATHIAARIGCDCWNQLVGLLILHPIVDCAVTIQTSLHEYCRSHW